MSALERAIAIRQPPQDVIHHSDRGSQYCSDKYQALLKKHGFIISMSGKGNCYGEPLCAIGSSTMASAMVETVFRTIKSELIWRTIYKKMTSKLTSTASTTPADGTQP